MKECFLIAVIYIVLASCTQPSNYEKPVVAPANITKNLMSWLYYERDFMVWSADYLALDMSSNSITKGQFLERLTTGRFLPVKIATTDSSLCYRLYKLEDTVDEEIGETIKNKAQLQYQYYKMEGKPLPGFNFIDLEGNNYDKNSAKGKILVLNCWFIRCKTCVEEMPMLNEVVSRFENRKDILFVGLAFDSEKDLKIFLKKTIFRYKIVADKEDYLMNELKIIGYPTHLIINRQGEIVKITNDPEEMVVALNKEILQ